ncbi:MAG: hypothetical protein RLZZ15_2503 [Verrucomicrobiota bacterium]
MRAISWHGSPDPWEAALLPHCHGASVASGERLRPAGGPRRPAEDFRRRRRDAAADTRDTCAPRNDSHAGLLAPHIRFASVVVVGPPLAGVPSRLSHAQRDGAATSAGPTVPAFSARNQPTPPKKFPPRGRSRHSTSRPTKRRGRRPRPTTSPRSRSRPAATAPRRNSASPAPASRPRSAPASSAFPSANTPRSAA